MTGAMRWVARKNLWSKNKERAEQAGEFTASQQRYLDDVARAWEEFAAQSWLFDISGDLQEWARTWLPGELAEATLAEVEAAKHRGQLPALPAEPVHFIESLIVKAVSDGVVVLPAPGRLARSFAHRDPVGEYQIASGYGLYVDGSDVLVVRAKSAIMYEDLGCVDGRPLKGAAAVERVLEQIIGTMQSVQSFNRPRPPIGL